MPVKLTEDNYVETAEKVIRTLENKTDARGKKIPRVTTSKIRNILSMTAELYTDIVADTNQRLSSEIIGRINYLKLRIIYEAGRDNSVKSFVQEAGLIECVEMAKTSRSAYILFSRYMEALVAYHKFLDGKD